jgi:hypothetical protein
MGVIDMNQLGHGGNVYPKPFIYDWAAVSANITPHQDAASAVGRTRRSRPRSPLA